MKYALPFLLSLCSFFCAGQNLVPNPSFEDTIECPMAANGLGNAEFWFSARATPDYLNKCANIDAPNIGIPNNWGGFQYPLEGSAYAAIATYQANPPTNYSEIISTSLKEALEIGKTYYVSANVSRGYSNITQCASNNFGFKFSVAPHYASVNPVLCNNQCHVNCNSIIIDTLGWTWVGGHFVADSAYMFLMFGNFYDSNNTDTLDCPTLPINSAYYFVDELCLSKDSVSCSDIQFAGYKKLNHETELAICPNPVRDILLVNNRGQAVPYLLFNSTGQVVLKGVLSTNTNYIDFTTISNGVFFLITNDKPENKIAIFHF